MGNVYDVENQNTYCPACGECLIERDWYNLGVYRLKGNKCAFCGEIIPGLFEKEKGNWGRYRLPVIIDKDDVRPGLHAREPGDGV